MKISLGPKTLPPAPVYVVGTYDKDERANMVTVAWAGICCSSPPCLTISLRKATYSYGNILERRAFTVNIPGEVQAVASDFFGLASGRDTDKLAVTGLTPVKSALVDAPYLAEFPMVIECKLIHSFEIGLHTMFVGEIKDVKADQDVLGNDGLPDMTKFKPFIFSSGDHMYYKTAGSLGKAFSIGEVYIT